MSAPGQERILVVDDERAIRELVRRLLDRAGYACATAGSGAEAEDLLAREPFELLLADLQMAGESGLDLIGRVRDVHRDTAAIMITGVDDPQLADKALELGAYGYIVKPFSPTELSIQVLNALRRRSLEIEQRDERDDFDESIELLEHGRATQFDADVLDAFLDALESESQVARIPAEAHL